MANPGAAADDYQRSLEAEGKRWGEHLEVERKRELHSWIDHPSILARYKSLGLIDHPIQWLNDPQLAFWSILIANIWLGIPFFTLLLYSALQDVPLEIKEAAVIDGAGPWARLRFVIVPIAGQPDLDDEALSRISEAFDGSKEIIGVPGVVHAFGGGGPHCITQQVPALGR